MKYRRHLRMVFAAAVASALTAGHATSARAALAGSSPVVQSSTDRGTPTSAAQSCATENDPCGDVVATVVSVANATLYCLDSNLTVPQGSGTPMLTIDIARACDQGLTSRALA